LHLAKISVEPEERTADPLKVNICVLVKTVSLSLRYIGIKPPPDLLFIKEKEEER
jgi:hypothetical protein